MRNMTTLIQKKIKPFEQLGVDFTEIRGNEIIGTCPFTGDDRKFFVNYEKMLWDSKTHGEGGDVQDFFYQICKHNAEKIEHTLKLAELAFNRKLPIEALEGYLIGWDGEKYTMPIYNQKGKVTDVRRLYIHNKTRKLTMYGITGAKVGLFNCDALLDTMLNDEHVYVCEGEWDAIALNWLLRKNKAPGIAVGTPGANTFKVEWREMFRKRTVTVCYDNDHAGAAGEQTVLRRLQDVTKKIDFIKWPEGVKEGFDVRDWVANGYKRKVFEKSFRKFEMLRVKKPRIVQADALSPAEKTDKKKRVITERANHKELFKTFSNQLKLDSEDTLAIVLATVLAHRLPGDPLWVLLVGKSGAGKTEFLTTLEDFDECVFTAEFTPHTLVSGMNTTMGMDPSLLPKLDNKVLVVKDFTVILSMHPTGRDEIFGQLREAYDGNYRKQFGNGLSREYEAHFGLLAGVTNKVDEYASLHAGLGERFLKYRVASPEIKMEQDIIMSAIMKAGKEGNMREELKAAVAKFLDNTPDDEPEITQEVAQVVSSIAIVVSRLRGSISINEYTNVQHSKAMFEMGTRLAKQLVRLWKGLVMYFGPDDQAEALALVKRVAMGNVVDKREEVVRVLYTLQLDLGEKEVMTRSKIAVNCHGVSESTVARELEELSLLGIVSSATRKGNKKHWFFTKQFQKMLDTSKLLL